MNNANARGPALTRAAEAMLRVLGGTEVMLRCPVAAAKDESARQLGLEAPITEDIAIAPVVVRAAGDGFELLIAPSSLTQLIAERGQSAEAFFSAVLAAFVGSREFSILNFRTDQFAGTEFLYRIQLTAQG